MHLITFAVTDGLGQTATASVTIDVRPYSVTVTSPFNTSPDNITGVIRISAWNDLLRATLDALDPSFIISFPSLPPGAAATHLGNPLGNSAEFKWRAMGVQFGPNLIPVHVSAGALTYDGFLTVVVSNPEPGWWTAISGEQTPVLKGTSKNPFATN